jgi:hypothetical protein
MQINTSKHSLQGIINFCNSMLQFYGNSPSFTSAKDAYNHVLELALEFQKQDEQMGEICKRLEAL